MGKVGNMSHMESVGEPEESLELVALVTKDEREAFMLRRGWVNASIEQRQELTEHWNDARIRMAIDMGLG